MNIFAEWKRQGVSREDAFERLLDFFANEEIRSGDFAAKWMQLQAAECLTAYGKVQP